MLGLASLRAAEEALRRWLTAAALVRPRPAGGTVVVVADASQRAVQALVRWDPATFASRELADRTELRFPPAARMASVTGSPEAVEALLAAARLPKHAELLGPLPAGSVGGGAGRSGRSGRSGQAHRAAPDAASAGTAPPTPGPRPGAIRYRGRRARAAEGEQDPEVRAGQAGRSSA